MNSIPSCIIDLIVSLCAEGEWAIGEVVVGGDFSIRHRADTGLNAAQLAIKTSPEAAREIAKYDASGVYRPLKTAPTLKRGWALLLESAADVRVALDCLYPAAMGTYLEALRGALVPTPLRETLNRQTGMYRLTQLTRDDQADELILSMCNSKSGCLRCLIWDLSPGRHQPLTEPLHASWPTREVPLICVEACNLLVAACRSLGKLNLPTANKPATP